MTRRECNNGMIYVIQAGDTLYQISRRYQVPLAVILRANPYIDIYNLQIGDEICIPLTPGGVQPPRPNYPVPPIAPLPPVNRPIPDIPVPPVAPLPPVNRPIPPIAPLPPNNRPIPPNRPTPYPPTYPTCPPDCPLGPPVPTPYPPTYPTCPPDCPLGPPVPTPPDISVPLPWPFDRLVVYVIQPGDTIADILDRFGISWNELMNYNNLNGMVLRPGMTINIPSVSSQNNNGMMVSYPEYDDMVEEYLEDVIEPEEE